MARIVNKPVNAVYEYVRSKIMSKALFPGNRISEEELASIVKVSRTSVRSAIARLQNDGLVEIVPNKGAFINRPTRENIESVYFSRLHLERAAVELAVPRFTADAIARMESNMMEQRALIEHFNILTYSQLNRAFHMEIVLAAQNEYLLKYLNELQNKTQIFMLFYDTSINNMGSLKTHGALLDAIKARDMEAACIAITKDNELSLIDLRGLQF